MDYRLAKILAGGSTAVAASGTAVPLAGVTYSTGTVTLVVGSAAVASGGGANFSAAHAALATAHVLFLLTNGGYLYNVLSVDATAETLTLSRPAQASEAGVAYKLYRMYDSNLLALHVPSGNTGGIWVGDSTVDKTSQNGLYISKGESLELEITMLADIWVDADTNADTISWLAIS